MVTSTQHGRDDGSYTTNHQSKGLQPSYRQTLQADQAFMILRGGKRVTDRTQATTDSVVPGALGSEEGNTQYGTI